ncbi:serine protease gd-like isoform X1 [Harmonia axyridis]|uniref:serine protease gd-like isoform X1 n=1 Tax=Harmonia axyridis TaxID=115357 RepID=UPI001E2790EA|nr:serine protease gd-like isoform X1 [Harmonia axyridis]
MICKMCLCGVRENYIIFCTFLFSTHLLDSVCSLKLGQFGHRQYYRPSFNPVLNSNQSPCPSIFEYRNDENGILFGFLQIPIPDVNVLELQVAFVVGNRIGKGEEGSITLPYPKDQILEHVQKKIPLNYRVNFPAWQGIPPKITKIVFNGDIICFGEPYSLSTVPVLTTIHLLHMLNINVTPLVSSPAFDQANPFNTDSSSKGLNERNEMVKFNINTDNFDNPRYFKPKDVRKVPKIIYKPLTDENPYSDNPFLKRLSSTTSRPIKENPFFTLAPSTEPVFEITPKAINTVSPKSQPGADLSSRDSSWQLVSKVCGLPVIINSLILHGKAVSRGAYPWLVAIFHTSDVGLSYKCTGVLISKKHVVTAAHCVRKNNTSDKIVMVLGRTNLWEVSDGEMIAEAEYEHVHPNYNYNSADSDIAVLELRKDVVFSVIIRPICLWNGDNDLNEVVGKTGLVVGWGKDETDLKFSPEPKQIELPIVSQERCLRSHDSYIHITSERTFCAGKQDGKGPCNGDSGGGFVMKKNGRWFLRGVVSMSLSNVNGSCDLWNYVVFTDASKYKDWLLGFVS